MNNRSIGFYLANLSAFALGILMMFLVLLLSIVTIDKGLLVGHIWRAGPPSFCPLLGAISSSVIFFSTAKEKYMPKSRPKGKIRVFVWALVGLANAITLVAWYVFEAKNLFLTPPAPWLSVVALALGLVQFAGATIMLKDRARQK